MKVKSEKGFQLNPVSIEPKIIKMKPRQQHKEHGEEYALTLVMD